jgi:hypothetical protein
MARKRSILAAACLSGMIALAAPAPDLTRYVNVFIGTGGHGHTYP